MNKLKRGGVAMDLREGDVVRLELPAGAAVDSEKIVITLEAKTGRKARLRIQADDAVRISRPERERDVNPH